jgi:hypothetical protein
MTEAPAVCDDSGPLQESDMNRSQPRTANRPLWVMALAVLVATAGTSSMGQAPPGQTGGACPRRRKGDRRRSS